jgi:hypothetical protein
MNAPTDLPNLVERLFFHQNQQTGRFEDALSTVHFLFQSLATGTGICTMLALVLTAVIVLIYRPRLTRGSFWMPAFGLFGGAPTLYLHTRPSSFCGVFTHTRRLKHRSRRGPKAT